MEAESSPLLRLPAEIRLLIYSHLFNDKGNKTISLRNRSHARQLEKLKTDQSRWSRSMYRAIERSFHQVCFATTYEATSDIDFSTAIMSASRKIYHETSELVYGRHTFDFGPDVEAVVPFFKDRFPATTAHIHHVSIQKRSIKLFESGTYDWKKMIQHVGSLDTLQRLTIVVEGGRPEDDWNGPKQLQVSDLRLLWQVQHESMEWISDLSHAAGVRELVIIPQIGYMPPPKTSSALLHAAFSASISTSFVDFLREDLQLPAVAGCRDA